LQGGVRHRLYCPLRGEEQQAFYSTVAIQIQTGLHTVGIGLQGGTVLAAQERAGAVHHVQLALSELQPHRRSLQQSTLFTGAGHVAVIHPYRL
jgi:hypothetical protein